MSLKVEPRRTIPWQMLYATPPLAVLLTVLTGFVLFLFMGIPPVKALTSYFVSPLLTAYGLSELCVKAAPLVMIAVGLAIGFRANVWNIGAEGQLTMGALAGGGVALATWGTAGVWILPLMLLAGILGGAAYAAIPAFLKARFEVSEILTSLMLTYVATLFLSIMVYGPLKDPEGYGFPQSRMFTESAIVPVIVENTRMHIGVVLALLVAAGAWVLMARSVIGFQVKVVGQAPAAARFAGFDRKRIIWLCLLLSGGLAGLAGTIEVSGPIGQVIPVLTPGYGFTAIIVAFLGRLHPLGIVPAGLLVALSYIGGENAQVEVGVPQGVTGLFQGLLLFFLLASDFLVRYRVTFAAPVAPRREVAPA
jgi:general nucleoside transport system permease protein